MMLLSLDGATALAQGVAERLGEPLAPVEHRPFHDGEHKWRPLEDPRGCDVFVMTSLHGDGESSPQDKLVRLLFMLSTLLCVHQAKTLAHECVKVSLNAG